MSSGHSHPNAMKMLYKVDSCRCFDNMTIHITIAFIMYITTTFLMSASGSSIISKMVMVASSQACGLDGSEVRTSMIAYSCNLDDSRFFAMKAVGFVELAQKTVDDMASFQVGFRRSRTREHRRRKPSWWPRRSWRSVVETAGPHHLSSNTHYLTDLAGTHLFLSDSMEKHQ